MKIISILAAISLLFVGCAVGNFPSAPNIKKQYLVQVKDEEIISQVFNVIDNTNDIPYMQEVVRCLSFDIVSWHPYQIHYVGVVPMKECHLVGGYKPTEVQGILNWVDDVYHWAEDRKHCFKD